MRDFWRGQTNAAAFASRFTGSSDLYEDDGRHRPPRSTSSRPTTASRSPTSSPTSTSTTRRTSRTTDDGNDDNRSWNCGVEGPTDDPEILALRARQQRNLLATLLLSQGVPMLARRRRARPDAGRQQQRLVPGQRDLVVRLGRRPSRERAGCVHPAPARAPPGPSGVPAHALPRRRPGRVGAPGRLVVPPRRTPDGPARLAEPLRHLGVFLNGQERTRDRARASRSSTTRSSSSSTPTPEPLVYRLPPRRFGLEWELELTTADPDAAGETYRGRSSVTLPARSLTLLRRSRD